MFPILPIVIRDKSFLIRCRSDDVIGLISWEMGPNYSHGPWYPFEYLAQLPITLGNCYIQHIS